MTARLRHLVPMLICAMLIMIAGPANAVWQDTVQAESTTSAGSLTAPVNLSCLGGLGGGSLSWDAVPNAAGYEVIGPLGPLGTLLNAVLTLVNGVLTYVLPAVALGTYQVRAVIPGTQWVSSYSSTVITIDGSLHLACT